MKCSQKCSKTLPAMSSGASKYSRSREAPKDGMPAHTASKRPSALEMAARSRRGGCHGAWSTGMACSWEAQARGQRATLHTASSVQLHLQLLNALCTAGTKQESKAAQECCHVQRVFHTGTQLWSLGLTTPGEREAAGHSMALSLSQHRTHSVTAEQHQPAVQGHPRRKRRGNSDGTAQGKENLLP